MPFWLLMIFAPKWDVTVKVMKSLWPVVPFVLTYAIFEIPHIASGIPLFIKPEWNAIQQLLGTDHGTGLTWAHFIAVDFFVGRWVYLDSRRNKMNVFLMAPILFFCSMICPFGFTLYLIARKLFAPKASMSHPDPE